MVLYVTGRGYDEQRCVVLYCTVVCHTILCYAYTYKLQCCKTWYTLHRSSPLKTQKIVTIHDLLFLKYPQFYNLIDRKIYHLKSRYACNKADKIIAVSQKTKNDIRYRQGN